MSPGIVEYIKELIEFLVTKMIDKPEGAKIQVSLTTKSILVQIDVPKSEIGKIVGKKGRSIDSLKTITTVIKNTQFLGDKKDVFIEIIEDENSNFYDKK